MIDHIRIIASDPGAKQYLWRIERDVKDWVSFCDWIKASDGWDWKYARPYVAGTYTWPETGRRLGVNLVERHVIQLDADSAGDDYLERLAEVADYQRLSHTTASHMQEEKGPRWRTLIPLSRGVTPSEYLTLSTYLVDLVGRERFDVQMSTSPAAASYAPAWPGVEYDEADGPVFDVDGLLMVAEELEWHPTTSVPDATVAEFLHEHPATGQVCAYGRSALDGWVKELEDYPVDVKAGFHQKIGNAGMRFVELTLAGCWSADDADSLRVVSNRRDDPRPKEFDEAIAYGLGKGCVADTGCPVHGAGSAAADVFDAIEGGEETGVTPNLTASFAPLDLVALLDPNRPPRTWLLDEVVPEGDHVSIVAPGGTGKSLLVLSLALAAVSGREHFIGRKIEFSGRVCFIDMENSPDDWAERLQDLGWTQETIGQVTERFIPLSLPPLRGLDTAEGAKQLRALLEAFEIGKGDLLVLDSTQRVTEGEENANDTVRNLYNLTSVWLKARGVTVIRTDNTGWEEGRVRGASSKQDDVGYSWLLKPVKKKGGEVFSLTSTKRRGRGDAEEILFTRASEVGDLVFTPVRPDDVAEIFEEIPPHMADTLMILWSLTNPGDDRYEDDKVSLRQVLGRVRGNSDTKRNGLEQLVKEGYAAKMPYVNKDGSESSRAPGYTVTEMGRSWLDEQGETAVNARLEALAKRV